MIKYTIKKSRFDSEYILWKTIASERGICFKNKFKGTYKECVNQKRKLEEEEKKNGRN